MSLAAALQGLFTTTAQALGKATGFIRRRRRLTAAGFAQTLVFRWMAKPKTTLESLARELGVSPQALRQRLGPQAQAFLLALLTEALGKALKVRPERLGALDRFPAVVVEDTTVIALPAELADEFPGCGGRGAGEGAAALKVLLRWDVRSGEVLALSVHAGRASDQGLAATAADLPEGALHLADQGFFNAERWRGFPAGRFWISRVPARTRVFWEGAWRGLSVVLGSLRGEGFDGAVRLVERADLPCRLVARGCPAGGAAAGGRAAQRREPVETPVRGPGVRPRRAGQPGGGRGGRGPRAGQAGPAAGRHPPSAQETEKTEHAATAAQPGACTLS